MNRCGYQPQQQQKALVGLGCVGDVRRGFMANSNGVVCPKPRRIIHTNDSISFRPSRLFHSNNQQLEAGESKAGTELLDIILSKGKEEYGGGEKPNFQVAFSSSPPFFSGSPPMRASNPVIQDEQFGNNSKISPLSPSSSFTVMDSPSSCSNGGGGGCVRVKFGYNPAPVRVEGFNCRRNNCSISAVA